MKWKNKESGSSQGISRLRLFTGAGSRKLPEDGNDRGAHSGKDLCLHDLFERQALRTPDNRALVYEQESLSYRELDHRANLLAQHLRSKGLGPDGVVGLLVERSLDMVVGILGILKAGAAYLPIDPAFPPERVAFMLADANVGWLLTQTRVLPDLAEGAPKTICMDAFDWTGMERPSRDEVHYHPR